MNDSMKTAIETIIEESRRLGVEGFEDALNAVGDELACGEKGDGLYLESVIDGVRWGARAAVSVELGGGALVRVALPDGVRITHEWADRHEADGQINRVMAALHPNGVVGEKVGD